LVEAPGVAEPFAARVAELAKQAPEMDFTTLAHHLDMAWMQEAFRRTRKDGAPGVDGLTAKDFEEGLGEVPEGVLGHLAEDGQGPLHACVEAGLGVVPRSPALVPGRAAESADPEAERALPVLRHHRELPGDQPL
jgi:hypothetical protein